MPLNLFKSLEAGLPADYGLEQPASIRNNALSGLALCGLTLFGRVKLPVGGGRWRLVPGAAAIYMLYRAGALYYYAKKAKFRQRDRMLDLGQMPPDARVLDLGSGRGLMAIGAARRSPAVRVVAADRWSGDWLSGRSEEALRSNIDLEELGGRIHVFTVSLPELQFEPGAFDLILCYPGISQVSSKILSSGDLAELKRVLAPGGRLVLNEYHAIADKARWLEEGGWTVTVSGPYYDTYPARSILVARPPAC